MTDVELEEKARLQYSRLLWKNPQYRRRLLFVWEHPNHPQRESFEKNRKLVEGLLECAEPDVYAKTVSNTNQWSVETLTREIPEIIGILWIESKEK